MFQYSPCIFQCETAAECKKWITEINKLVSQTHKTEPYTEVSEYLTDYPVELNSWANLDEWILGSIIVNYTFSDTHVYAHIFRSDTRQALF